jgi:hypothetical protein
MNRPLTLLLAIVVLAHALAGCCWHHAHAADGGAPVACSDHAHCHEHGGAEEGDNGDGPAKPCDEGNCVFVRGQGSPSIDFSLALALEGCVASAGELSLDDFLVTRAAYPDTQDLAPHTRLHLLHQILLI